MEITPRPTRERSEKESRSRVGDLSLAAALRGHQAALKAAKSPQREEAAAFLRKSCG